MPGSEYLETNAYYDWFDVGTALAALGANYGWLCEVAVRYKWNLIKAVVGLVIGIAATSSVEVGEAVSEQSFAAQGMAPIVSLPEKKLSLPFMAGVLRSLQSQHQDSVLVALRDLDQRAQNTRIAAAGKLRAALSSVDTKSRVALKLQLARHTAGFTAGGARLGGANMAYRSQLAGALQSAQSLDEADRIAAGHYAISLWRMAEGAKIDWAKPPFRLSLLRDDNLGRALIERSAIADAQSRDYKSALRKYKALTAGASGSVIRADFDMRALHLARLMGEQSNKPGIYESQLIALEKDYLDPSLLGSGNEARAKSVASEVVQRHKQFVLGTMTRAASQKASRRDRAEAIAMAHRLLKSMADDGESISVKSKMAGLYEKSQQYAEAVAIYKELAASAQEGSRTSYMVAAIRAQSILASWPLTVPWNDSKHGHEDARTELLSLYQQLSGNGQQKSWEIAAHQGLLMVDLGRRDDAYTLWQDQLKSQPAGVHAGNAAGHMLSAYAGDQNWPELEKMARFVREHKIAAVHHGKPIDTSDHLALALLEQGKGAIGESKYKDATKKLIEVVKQFPRFKRCDEAMFLLSSAYRGAGEHTAAINTLVAFDKRFATSRYYRQAMLNGGEWSQNMALEEQAAHFYERFLAKFAKDQESQKIRDQLTSLHVGLGHYASALSVLHATVANATDSQTKSAALVQIMEIERRSGSMVRAAATAKQIASTGDVGDDGKASALAVRAQVAASQGKFAEVQTIERELQGLSGQIAQESLAGTRFILANARSKDPIKSFNNLELRDPLATLKSHYGTYRSVRQAYNAVCDVGSTSFCPLAMMKLSQLSATFAEHVQDISIQDSLAPEVVSRFKSQQAAIMSDVTSTAQQSDAKALAMVQNGHSDPDTTQAVLWQAAGDWQSDRVSGSTGNGFVQWSVDEGAGHE
ncbi:MAG: hypothetical protein FJ146_09860 [Deltaproteobacteria bacterium]|nr:hypothetical protein [Deltaproteobacteria bacterium]